LAEPGADRHEPDVRLSPPDPGGDPRRRHDPQPRSAAVRGQAVLAETPGRATEVGTGQPGQPEGGELKTATRKHVALAAVLGIGAFLRLWNLGYSNFQGDEVKALFPSGDDVDLHAFLFDQRKGPLQFLVTYGVRLADPQYSSELLARLPFALAAVVSLWFFYRFVELQFGSLAALVATFFYSTNGMIVALSRIVQYQSLVMLFVCMALYYFALAVRDERWRSKGVMLGAICWALGTLAHYDALLILPFVLYLVIEYYRAHHTLKPAVLPGAVFAVAVASFYIPFALSISEDTRGYWSNRLTGGTDKISSSTYLFEVYNPLFTLQLYAVLSALGIGYLLHASAKRQDRLRNAFLVLWISGVVIFFEGVVNLPGTHIFNYLMPLMILMGLGVSFVVEGVRLRGLRVAASAAFVLVGLFLVVQSYALYVDHRQAYPWAPEQVLGLTVPPVKIDRYHTSLFGFPYDGGWRDIKNHLADDPDRGDTSFLTNDKGSIAEFYMAGYDEGPEDLGFYIHVRHPQSFNPDIAAGPIADWTRTHRPAFSVRREGQLVAELYEFPEGWARGP
jgi:4-amino-4-deoxy-L-arabinose transferase-like glycosyltransferase